MDSGIAVAAGSSAITGMAGTAGATGSACAACGTSRPVIIATDVTP
ncbi:hypothetical protein [Kibdelosporangium persicum]|nr:hypothetical protein [Kibdelosporangium persicum]